MTASILCLIKSLGILVILILNNIVVVIIILCV